MSDQIDPLGLSLSTKALRQHLQHMNVPRTDTVQMIIYCIKTGALKQIMGRSHKRHPIPHPLGRAMECLLWIIFEKIPHIITAPNCLMSSAKDQGPCQYKERCLTRIRISIMKSFNLIFAMEIPIAGQTVYRTGPLGLWLTSTSGSGAHDAYCRPNTRQRARGKLGFPPLRAAHNSFSHSLKHRAMFWGSMWCMGFLWPLLLRKLTAIS